jgi:hypothetical protein
MNAIPKQVYRESQLVQALEYICQALELTATQHNAAREHYEAVADWLLESTNPLLQNLIIYPHGSIVLGTTVKPHGRNEHDVDLVSRAPSVNTSYSPVILKTAIGQRLREHAHYRPILKEKRRCWRLEYANEFHLDITPSILNPACDNGGELVPDKELMHWQPTNPQGYLRLFERRALLRPSIRFTDALLEKRGDAAAPFPRQTRLKGILRRLVQLAKRHRDIHFEHGDVSIAPISIVITTLLAQAYEKCVRQSYDSELQLLIDVIRMVPQFIEGPTTNGTSRWAVWNETTEAENFAEKWNRKSLLATAFFQWHAKFLADIERITDVYGLDRLTKSLAESFGERPARMARDALTVSISTARVAGNLVIAPAIGLASNARGGTAVRSNTFFGA